jgi:hypothetical protein
MERNIFKILESYKRLNEIQSEFDDYITSNEEVEESADTIRNYSISKLGWTEKGKELSSGGEVSKELADIINNLMYTFSQTSPTCKGTFTAGNDSYHKGIKKYKSLHTTGLAVDVTIDNTSCRQKFIELLNKFVKDYPGFSYIDEYKNPTGESTGGHFHISYRKGKPEGSSKEESSTEKKDETSTETNPDATQQSKLDSEFGDYDKTLAQIGTQLLSPKPLGEQFSPQTSRFKSNGVVVLPAKDNKKIITPGSGVVTMWSKNSCKNGFSVLADDKYLIEFCNADQVLVRDGKTVSANDTVAKTFVSDVIVTFYNKDESTLGYIPSKFKLGQSEKKSDRDLATQDPVLSTAFTFIPKMFQDKYDEKTGDRVQKRWGSATSQDEVDPWILQNAEKAAKKIKNIFSPNKGVNEEIVKIKKLIK